MTESLEDVFSNAIRIVAEADRSKAEADNRRQELLLRSSLEDFDRKVASSFDFLDGQRIGMETRVEIYDQRPGLELLMRRHGTIFVLLPNEADGWELCVSEDSLTFVQEISGAVEGDNDGRKLAGARVIAAIANWLEQRTKLKPEPSPAPTAPAPPTSQPLVQPASGSNQVAPPVADLLSLIAQRMEQNRRPAPMPIAVQRDDEEQPMGNTVVVERQQRQQMTEKRSLAKAVEAPMQSQAFDLFGAGARGEQERNEPQSSAAHSQRRVVHEKAMDESTTLFFENPTARETLGQETHREDPFHEDLAQEDLSHDGMFSSSLEMNESVWRRIFRRR